MNDFEPASPGRTGSMLMGFGLGALTAALGLFFCGALWVGMRRATETRAWTETPCRIVEARVVEERPTPSSPVVHRAMVRYTYSFEGGEYEGHRARRVDGPAKDVKKAEAVVAAYPAGSEQRCWVNPAEPRMAILRHNTRAVGYTMWFPALFVVAGIGIMFGSVRGRRRPA